MMPDKYLSRLIKMVEDEVNHPRWGEYGKPCDLEIDQLLNNICAELDITLRFYRVENDLLKITCENLDEDYKLFPLVVKHFRNEYPLLVQGPEGCL